MKGLRTPSRFVGENVRRVRQASKGITGQPLRQQDLADLLGWTQSKVAQLERGEVMRLTFDDVVALAYALGVQVVHLTEPTGGVGQMELLPGVELDALTYRDWMRGVAPLTTDDEQAALRYFASEIAPPGDVRAGFMIVTPVTREAIEQHLTAE